MFYTVLTAVMQSSILLILLASFEFVTDGFDGMCVIEVMVLHDQSL